MITFGEHKLINFGERCSFCVDVKTASRVAWEMDTQSRVYRFGTPDIIDQYEALTIDDFRQEFENELTALP